MITAQQMLEAMEKAVAARGDGYTYPDRNNCQYYYVPEEHKMYEDGTLTPLGVEFGDEAQPACLVGLALDYIEEFSALNLYETGNNETGIDSIRLVGRQELSQEAAQIAMAGQSRQDAGGTWGEALVAAKEIFSFIESRNFDAD